MSTTASFFERQIAEIAKQLYLHRANRGLTGRPIATIEQLAEHHSIDMLSYREQKEAMLGDSIDFFLLSGAGHLAARMIKLPGDNWRILHNETAAKTAKGLWLAATAENVSYVAYVLKANAWSALLRRLSEFYDAAGLAELATIAMQAKRANALADKTTELLAAASIAIDRKSLLVGLQTKDLSSPRKRFASLAKLVATWSILSIDAAKVSIWAATMTTATDNAADLAKRAFNRQLAQIWWQTAIARSLLQHPIVFAYDNTSKAMLLLTCEAKSGITWAGLGFAQSYDSLTVKLCSEAAIHRLAAVLFSAASSNVKNFGREISSELNLLFPVLQKGADCVIAVAEPQTKSFVALPITDLDGRILPTSSNADLPILYSFQPLQPGQTIAGSSLAAMLDEQAALLGYAELSQLVTDYLRSNVRGA